MPLLPIVLVIHICLALALFVPALVLPFALGRGGSPYRGASGAETEARPGRLVGLLLTLQGSGSVVIAIGLTITGLALVAILGLRIVEQPWLLIALAIYVGNLAIAVVIQRPNLRRLVADRGGSALGPEESASWRDRARRQRYVSYAMAGLVGAIGWLMSTKPALW